MEKAVPFPFFEIHDLIQSRLKYLIASLDVNTLLYVTIDSRLSALRPVYGRTGAQVCVGDDQEKADVRRTVDVAHVDRVDDKSVTPVRSRIGRREIV